ncbi:MAG: cytochrome c maturation protein CcmE [Alphaproteobacteria bacterium]|nr:cytochrome c maturation protein CcmE [Alphaproteobacteria bacterium]
MRHRNRRLATIAAAGSVLVAAVALGLFALQDAVVFFYSPSDVMREPPVAGERVRVGGLVKEGTVEEVSEAGYAFVITDLAEDVRVTYTGILPDLFREGQGVVAEGRFDTLGVFAAETVLAKHDETYMPPEVAEALREAGVWEGDEPEPESR